MSTIEQRIVGGHNIVTGTGDVRIVYQLPAAEADDRRALLVLLERVRQFWVVGVLDDSVLDPALLQLDTAPAGSAIAHPWAQLTELSESGLLTARHQSIGNLFDRSGRALLILGVEGSGKTTALLQLTRSLISRAESDPAQPIPVVLNLASWRIDTRGLLPWLVAELQSKYYVPAHIARSWVERQRIAILLDGLDEVAEPHLQDCVVAINRFLRDVGAAGITVCSRLAEYMAQPERLALGGAVRLEPLTAKQVESYLSAGGTPLDGLRTALAADNVLREMASSPLLLSVMSLAYRGETSPAALQERDASEEARRKDIFDTYVSRMFTRRVGESASYPKPETLRWLSGFARDMLGHGRRVLLVEGLQPDLLQSAAERAAYVLLSRAAMGILLGAMEGVYLLTQTGLGSLLWKCVLVGLFFAFAVAIVDWLRLRQTGNDQQSGSPEAIWRTAAVTAFYWVLFGLLHALIGMGVWRAPFGLIWALLFALRGRRQSARTDIQPVSGLTWSWRHAAKGGLWGLLVGLAVGTTAAIVSLSVARERGILAGDYLTLYLLGLLYAVLGAAFGGVIRVVGNSLVLGRGMRLTIRAAIRGSLLTAGASWGLVTATATFGVLIFWTFDPAASEVLAQILAAGGMPATTTVVLVFAALAGLILGILVGVYFGLLGWLWYGGADAIQHVVLRWLLWRRDRIPWRLSRFLDYGTRLILLQRVGGGYSFVHSALMEHFAAPPPPAQ